MQVKKFLNIMLLIPGLLILSGCGDWFGGSKKSDSLSQSNAAHGASQGSQKMVVTIEGGGGITEEEFRANFEILKQAQPMLEQMLPFMPVEQQRVLYTQVLEGIAGNQLIYNHVQEQGWDKEADYQARAEQLRKDFERELANREFQGRIMKSLVVTDSELEKFYIAHRSTNMIFKRPPFLLANEGIKALAVKAQDAAQAQALMEAAQKSGDLKQAAKALNLTVQDLGTVTSQSMEHDRLVVIKLLGMQKFPSVATVKSGDTNWVVQGLSKKDAEFALFDQVKDAVREVVLSDRFQKEYMDQLEVMKKKHKLTVDQAFVETLLSKQNVAEHNDAVANKKAS